MKLKGLSSKGNIVARDAVAQVTASGKLDGAGPYFRNL
ncbi:MAG: hypothetical protein OFPI_08620 [Osedax symbiont Rs2]|nr:MAG: hypothetical protein OFPI_08620 [Osedax symbiont Rs2]